MFMAYTQKWNQKKSHWVTFTGTLKPWRKKEWNYNYNYNLRLAPFFLKHQFYQMAPKTGKTAYLICVYVQEVCVNSP